MSSSWDTSDFGIENIEFEESEIHVTTFLATNDTEKRRSTTKDKFERINDDTTLDTDTEYE